MSDCKRIECDECIPLFRYMINQRPALLNVEQSIPPDCPPGYVCQDGVIVIEHGRKRIIPDIDPNDPDNDPECNYDCEVNSFPPPYLGWRPVLRHIGNDAQTAYCVDIGPEFVDLGGWASSEVPANTITSTVGPGQDEAAIKENLNQHAKTLATLRLWKDLTLGRQTCQDQGPVPPSLFISDSTVIGSATVNYALGGSIVMVGSLNATPGIIEGRWEGGYARKPDLHFRSASAWQTFSYSINPTYIGTETLLPRTLYMMIDGEVGMSPVLREWVDTSTGPNLQVIWVEEMPLFPSGYEMLFPPGVTLANCNAKSSGLFYIGSDTPEAALLAFHPPGHNIFGANLMQRNDAPLVIQLHVARSGRDPEQWRDNDDVSTGTATFNFRRVTKPFRTWPYKVKIRDSSLASILSLPVKPTMFTSDTPQWAGDYTHRRLLDSTTGSPDDLMWTYQPFNDFTIYRSWQGYGIERARVVYTDEGGIFRWMLFIRGEGPDGTEHFWSAYKDTGETPLGAYVFAPQVDGRDHCNSMRDVDAKTTGPLGAGILMTVTTLDFVVPALNSLVIIEVESTAGFTFGQVTIGGGGYTIWNIPGPTTIQLRNDTDTPGVVRSAGAVMASPSSLEADEPGVLPAIDDITLGVNDLLLVANEPDAARNGIYRITSVGSESAPWTMRRETGFYGLSNNSQIWPGRFVQISGGTVHGGEFWAMSPGPGPYVLEMTPINWVEFLPPIVFVDPL